MPSRRDTPQRHAVLIGRALAHVDTHLDQALDADTLADRAAMSRFHFHRAFHAHVGCSVGDYVAWRRLQRACALLASGHEPVLEIALAVGYESAQALAKAMRRELGTTPGSVRRGDAAAWKSLLDARRWTAHAGNPHGPSPCASPACSPTRSLSCTGDPTMTPTRFATIPAVPVLSATARGMVDHNMTRAAQQAFGELVAALGRHALYPQVDSWLGAVLDAPKGPDDPHCRYLAAVSFGYRLHDQHGTPAMPELALTGSLAWQTLAAGRYAVFDHIGPYTLLYRSWDAIYRDWLPASGERLRDAMPFEVNLNSPQDTPPEQLHTEIWLPLA